MNNVAKWLHVDNATTNVLVPNRVVLIKLRNEVKDKILERDLAD